MDFATIADVYRETGVPTLSIIPFGIVLLVVLPVAVLIGHRAGNLRRRQTIASGEEIDLVAGQTSLGGILTLLGLLLAFSFGNALNIAQTRKITAIEEAAALSTVFDRADYLPEAGRAELKAAILKYAKTRVIPTEGGLDNTEKVLNFLDTSLQAQAKLWPLVLNATADPLPPPIKIFVAGAMNDALDAHLFRMQAFSVPVASISQATLIAAALAALFMLGNRSGLVGRALTWRVLVFAGFLFVVMMLIVDLHRGAEGLIRFDQTALLAVIFEMEASL